MPDKSMTQKAVLVAGFQHETNTFAPTKAKFENFARGEGRPALPHGEDVLALRDVNIPVGGFILAAEAQGWTLLPTVWASACPSAHVTEDAYERIVAEILAAVRQGGFDAIYLDLHGAMVAEHVDDGEGELLERIRRLVGPDIPVVASLDLHANVTEKMLDNASALVAFRTYPHVDMAATGARAAMLLRDLLKNKRPFMSSAKRLPFLIPINGMCTLVDPAMSMYAHLDELEGGGVRSLSFCPGFPAADFPECGPVIWGYGDDPDVLSSAVTQLYERMLAEEETWRVPFLSPAEAVGEALRLIQDSTASGPVVIADTQDNPGAGADSNTAGMLQALIEMNATHAAIGLIDAPEVAAAAHAAGVGNFINATFGGKSGAQGDLPFTARFEVVTLSDGKCRYDGPMFNGATAKLGLVAGLRHGSVHVAVGSIKAQMLDRNLFRVAGIEPENMRILVNKSSVHFRADFQPIARAVLVAKAPGPMLADPADLPWTRLRQGMRLGPNGPAFSAEG